jgi:site-specific DNA-methyltransferase (adenine-specific)
MTLPYYADDWCTLYLGDMRDILPTLALTVDAVITDPPYGETSLKWDRWVDGWPALAATAARTMWCFGSMRMFLAHVDEFTDAGWKFSQDIVWEKNTGSSSANDRFKRVHENATHWYQSRWADQHQAVPRTAYYGADNSRRLKSYQRPDHWGSIGGSGYECTDSRLMTSVLRVRSMHGYAIHPTEKPVGILDPLIRYACPPAGLVLDLFAGSGSTLDAARQTGRRAVGIEGDERYIEAAAKRLCQRVIDFEGALD